MNLINYIFNCLFYDNDNDNDDDDDIIYNIYGYIR